VRFAKMRLKPLIQKAPHKRNIIWPEIVIC
jgi:hypothetical protein